MQQLSALSPRQDDRQVDETWSSTTSVGIDRSITRACVMAGQARPSPATVESVAVHARGTHRTESCSCSRSVHGKPARPDARHHACGRRHRHKISCECGQWAVQTLHSSIDHLLFTRVDPTRRGQGCTRVALFNHEEVQSDVHVLPPRS